MNQLLCALSASVVKRILQNAPPRRRVRRVGNIRNPQSKFRNSTRPSVVKNLFLRDLRVFVVKKNSNLFRAKHVLSEAEGTPSSLVPHPAQLIMSELGDLCAFARDNLHRTLRTLCLFGEKSSEGLTTGALRTTSRKNPQSALLIPQFYSVSLWLILVFLKQGVDKWGHGRTGSKNNQATKQN